jgi:hypothetical protein
MNINMKKMYLIQRLIRHLRGVRRTLEHYVLGGGGGGDPLVKDWSRTGQGLDDWISILVEINGITD